MGRFISFPDLTCLQKKAKKMKALVAKLFPDGRYDDVEFSSELDAYASTLGDHHVVSEEDWALYQDSLQDSDPLSSALELDQQISDLLAYEERLGRQIEALQKYTADIPSSPPCATLDDVEKDVKQVKALVAQFEDQWKESQMEGLVAHEVETLRRHVEQWNEWVSSIAQMPTYHNEEEKERLEKAFQCSYYVKSSQRVAGALVGRGELGEQALAKQQEIWELCGRIGGLHMMELDRVAAEQKGAIIRKARRALEPVMRIFMGQFVRTFFMKLSVEREHTVKGKVEKEVAILLREVESVTERLKGIVADSNGVPAYSEGLLRMIRALSAILGCEADPEKVLIAVEAFHEDMRAAEGKAAGYMRSREEKINRLEDEMQTCIEMIKGGVYGMLEPLASSQDALLNEVNEIQVHLNALLQQGQRN